MSRFLEALRSGRVLLMDGAMGTELRRAGLADRECSESWNITHPARIATVHQAYVDAGAEVFLANTFQANRPTLSPGRGGGSRPVFENIKAAREIVAPVLSDNQVGLVSVGPIVEPPDTQEFARLLDIDEVIGAIWTLAINRQFQPLSGILLETCSSPRVRFAVWRAVKPGVPVLLSLTYRRDPDGQIITFSGHTPEWFARRAKDWGVAALGVNCGRDIGMDEIIEIVRRYRQETDLPLFARPNAGTPTKQDNRWVYPHTPEQMAARVPELLAAGASMIGGCCGTTPEHIAAFRRVLDQIQ
jgi:5-methyltetrahydrofolate--homocysteine methyltransferase